MRADLIEMQDASSPDTRPPLPPPVRPDLADAFPSVPDHALGRDFFRSPARPRVAGVVALVLASVILLGTAITPALRAWEARGRSKEFTFMASHAGDPVRWNPCEAIHYVVNLGAAPTGSLKDVQDAVLRLTDATGIAFVYDGFSDEVPVLDRDVFQPSRYGDRWAPVLIGWVDPRTSSIAFVVDGQEAAGIAGPLTPDTRADVYVSGVVAINAADPNPPGFASPGAQGPVVLHELAHVLGLGHIKAQGELMEPSGGGVTDFGPGDLEGLRELGSSAGCLSTPVAPSG